MKLDNLFDAIPKDLDEELFELILKNEGLSIERIVSRGHASPPTGWYDQDKHEWVLLLKGAATIVLEGSDPIELQPGSHLNIPAHTRHKVSWTSPDTETIWLAVHY